MKEIFKPVPGWPDYQASNLGNILSLKFGKRRILKGRLKYGYFYVNLYKEACRQTFLVHQLVAMAFLGHAPKGLKLVVNHKDFNKLNNRADNLEIVTQRENANRKHLQSTSKYTGVSWHKAKGKWQSEITENRKRFYLGDFNCEIEASKAYQKKLNEIIN